MARLILQVRNALFGFGVLAALGFGVSQASAAAPHGVEWAAVCNEGYCNAHCQSLGARLGTCADGQYCECHFEV